MPQSSDELHERWDGEQGVCEDKAIAFLEARGYVLQRNWRWKAPHEPDYDEWEAMRFLVEEWDFGGFDLDEHASSGGSGPFASNEGG